MSPNDLKHLLKNNRLNTLDAEEYANLQSLLHDPLRQDELEHLIEDSLQQTQPVKALATQEYLYQLLKERHGIGNDSQVPFKRSPFIKMVWFRYAAAILLAISIGAYYWLHNNQEQSLISDNNNLQADIAPGKEGAILTLADGSQIVLDSMENGLIAAQNGSKVLLQNGNLSYHLSEKTTDVTVYNTMSTPVGRQFQMTLPDGTKVWLNAASSIRYPTAFTGKERKVFVTGEAYFEVAQNAKKPFRVNIRNIAEVDVLGTSFNINAYENESTLYTTLLDGSIKVSGRIIKPGQQAQLSVSNVSADHPHPPHDQVRIVHAVDIDKVMAWKNGMFNFENASLEAVMRQLERWYDIEVVYEKGVPAFEFGGKMSKDIPLNGLLIALKKSKVNFRMEVGRRLVVLP